MTAADLELTPASARDAAWIARESELLGGPLIVSAGRLWDLRVHPAVVARRREEPAGFAVYRDDGSAIEVLAIKAMPKHRGTGSALLAAVEEIARSLARPTVWLCTSNDNLDALRFYQRRGCFVRAYRANAFREVLRLKGQDPEQEVVGHYGIVIRDLIELSKAVAIKGPARQVTRSSTGAASAIR